MKRRKYRTIALLAGAAVLIALFAVFKYVLLPQYPLYTHGGQVFYTPQAQRALFRDHREDFDALRDAIGRCEAGFHLYWRNADQSLLWYDLDREAQQEEGYPPDVVEAARAFFEAHHCSGIHWMPERGTLYIYFYATDAARRQLHDEDGFAYYFQTPDRRDLWNQTDMGGGWYWFAWPVR